MFTHENILALHSNPLGVMCQSFFRCEAARALIAAPNLMAGAAIFFTAARVCQRSGVHPHRGEKTYRPDFIEAGCMGGRRVCSWGAGPSIESVVMLSSSEGLVQRLDPFRPAAWRFPLRGFRVRRG